MQVAESSQNLLHKDVRVSINGTDTTLSLTSRGDVEGRSSTGTCQVHLKYYCHSSARFRFSEKQTVPLTPVYNVIWTEVDGDSLELTYLDRRKKGKSRLTHVNARIQDADKLAAQEWCQVVMAAAYTGALR